MTIPYYHRYSVPDHVKQRVLEVIDANIHYLGPYTDRLETGLAQRFQKKHAVTTNAGSGALLLALHAMGIGPGDEVVVPTATYAGVAEAAVHAGATPVLAECEPDTGNLDIERVHEVLSPRTRAIVLVHQYGHPADIDPFVALARDKGYRLIENCSHAFMAKYKGRPVGSFGHVGITAMSHKHLTVAGTGGAAFTDDDDLAHKMRMMRHHGNWGKTPDEMYNTRLFGYKMYLNEVQACVGAHQLDTMDAWIAARRRNATLYTQLLQRAGVPVEVAEEREYAWSSFLHFPLMTDRRDDLRAFLNAEGIEAKAHYVRPIHLHDAFQDKFGFARGMLPVSERFCDRVMSLPVAPHVTEEDVHRIVERIQAFFAG
jgi:dTDP-4-amino-4,6-dideoxygalactose transaminase